MNHNKRVAKTQNNKTNGKRDYNHNKRGGRHDGRQESKPDMKDLRLEGGKLDKGDRDNDPNYYFTDKALAESVTQLSFQQLAGYPVEIGNQYYPVPNIVTIAMNPSPGVTRSADYGSPSLNKMAGINLAGFKLFSMLAAYTGRQATYGPQDISTMILMLGELLSTAETIRRMFGVAFSMNMRNRSYPRDILTYGMRVDADDLFANFSDYRTRFNALITLVNQIPIPSNIEYLRKCLEMYQHIYLDQDSAMAQTLVPMPFSTWIMDEVSNPAGTVLKSYHFICPTTNFNGIVSAPYKMSDYLDILDTQVGLMLNSSTLQVVYTDLLNLATKGNMKFVALDYLSEGYIVLPAYNANFSLQMHNATIAGVPNLEAADIIGTYNITAYNDVIPNASTNSLFYNPAFQTIQAVAGGAPRTGDHILIDMLTDTPSVEDRVEVTRYTSISGQNEYASGKLCDAILPDHYVASVAFWTNEQGAGVTKTEIQTTVIPDVFNGTPLFKKVACLSSNIDWAPRIYECDNATGAYTGYSAGDLNFYTVLDANWLKKVNQFIALGLYTVR